MAISVLDVQRVLVIGAGTMGTGIAQVAARAG
jgi:3-hydroxyacyl-CoA dehydrogenase